MTKKVRDYKALAQQILEAVGGEDNIVNVTRCATRLRIVLKRSKPKAKEVVSSLPGVITVVENNGQFQVVIGQHVGTVYDAFILLVEDKLDMVGSQEKSKGTILNRIIATMSAVFAPFIYVLAAAGILQGFLIILRLIFPTFSETGTHHILSMMSWAPFTFLPIFITLTAAKHFKVNVYIAMAITAALLTPEWTNMAQRIADGESIKFLGVSLSETTYASTVLPPLFLVWLLSYVEKYLNKWIPEVTRALFVPFFSILIMVPLVLMFIGPITAGAANAIANGYNFLADTFPPLAGAIIGGFFQVFVIFGVHWGVTPMVLANYEQYGMDSFQAYQTIAVIAQIGAVIGVILKTKNKETRKISTSAGITGIFGITEPTIYGVTLRFKKPFIFGSFSGAVGAVAASFFNPKYFAYAGLPGPITLLNGMDKDYPMSIWGILLGTLIALILPIILIQIFGYGEDSAKQVASDLNNNGIESQNDKAITMNGDRETVIYAPLKGRMLVLSDVPDPVFSSGAMGQGVAIEPTDNDVYAPISGEIVFIAPTKHAIGIQGYDGEQLLIHVGLETVSLEGKPFTLHISDGQTVKQGEKILTFDRLMIQDKGMSTITPIVVTNSDQYNQIIVEELKEVKVNQQLLNLIKS
ncbi:beta-glucoside-specific PTS transporter subunit IIABC [Staphylococcus sp. 17KM0847]|uniref:beta-glucoside-specific PTS transporter subunit IIABC n=1 Tax=Staphylococcus sp. 17KM0847 TaxID=2583989 RepID=UPI0015DCE023|nr:beta-glucoside-specific PTS transporter subunit IIABC [Staphylococcus sp. 17KM0847]QLK86576.1 PTS beta-glucoside transporter subunit EIIBCA [Staphylococcus sp. 17KM0847]